MYHKHGLRRGRVALSGIVTGPRLRDAFEFTAGSADAICGRLRLKFAAFWKSRRYGGGGCSNRSGGARCLHQPVLGWQYAFAISTSVSAQMFNDHPPPVPPARSRPGSASVWPRPPVGFDSHSASPLTQPSMPPPLVAAASRVDARQAVLSLTTLRWDAGHHQRAGVAVFLTGRTRPAHSN
jgi:hypothetical protein